MHGRFISIAVVATVMGYYWLKEWSRNDATNPSVGKKDPVRPKLQQNVEAACIGRSSDKTRIMQAMLQLPQFLLQISRRRALVNSCEAAAAAHPSPYASSHLISAGSSCSG